MKNKSKLLLFIMLVSIIFASCKKGEDDPFLSLRTRTNRLAGDWELTGLNITYNEISSSYNHTSYTTFSNGLFISTEDYGTYTETDTMKINYNFKIEKSGFFTQTYSSDSDSGYREGNWMWLNKNKELDLKNKEAFIISVTKEISDNYTDNYSGKYIIPDNIYVLKKLTYEEIVFLIEDTQVNKNGNTYIESGTLTFKRK